MGVATAVGKALLKPFVRRFVAGPTPDDALATVRTWNARGVGGIVSSLGEHVRSEKEAREGVAGYREVLDLLGKGGTGSDAGSSSDVDGCISVKPTHMGLEVSRDLAEACLMEVVEHARDRDIFVWVDMERSTFTDDTLDLFEEMHDAWDRCGVCLQANLKRTGDDLDRMLDRGAAVRLVKGAYDEPAAIAHRDKARIDRAFSEHLETLFRDGADTGFAVATHDPALIEQAKGLYEAHGGTWEYQMLLGVRDEAKAGLVREGYRVQVYIPYGTEWFPYYWRRIRERRENLWFALRAATGR